MKASKLETILSILIIVYNKNTPINDLYMMNSTTSLNNTSNITTKN